jgi:C-3',4' desaturase CrtD
LKPDRSTTVAVIGAGIGGAAVGALLAHHGYRVELFEARSYPGGCASTFRKNGFMFDSGATVGCGFHTRGPLCELASELGIQWKLMPCPVAWEYRCGSLGLRLTASRSEVLERFPRSRPFWEEQERLAGYLWQLAARAPGWPPSDVSGFFRLFQRVAGMYAALPALARHAFRTVGSWLKSHQLDRDEDFLRFIDAQLLISLQTTSADANALLGAIALDLPVRGTHRLTGGIGQVAQELVASIERNGGRVRYGCRIKGITVRNGRVTALSGEDDTVSQPDLVIANMPPESLLALAGPSSSLRFRQHSLPEWSAFTLYLEVREELFGGHDDHHIQIVAPSGSLGEGRSVFVSVSPSDDALRAPEGFRAVTVSTHTRPDMWFRAYAEGRSAYEELKTLYTGKIVDLLETRLPSLRVHCMNMTAATPVTWHRYTGRNKGYVGGSPQISLFRVLGPNTSVKNLYLTGDSVFPGQSLPGVVSGARHLVDLILNKHLR